MQPPHVLTDEQLRYLYLGGASRSTLRRRRLEHPHFPPHYKDGKRNLTLRTLADKYLAHETGESLENISQRLKQTMSLSANDTEILRKLLREAQDTSDTTSF